MTHGLKHELSSSLPPTVSGGTTGLTNIPKYIHITPAHRDTHVTPGGQLDHVAPSVYLKYTAALLLLTINSPSAITKESRTKEKHF